MRTPILLLARPLSVACGGSSVPAGLADIDGTAEDANNKALVSDYAAVSADADTLTSAWKDYRDQAEADGASVADLGAMDDAIDRLSAAVDSQTDLTELELARAANAVSGPMDELYSLYDDPVPSSILALDYGGRKVSIDGMEEGMGDALEDIGELETVWAGVKLVVFDAGGDAKAADYDSSLATQRDLADQGDAEGLLSESNNSLEIVDALEGVFGG